jgi:hypothetical protein
VWEHDATGTYILFWSDMDRNLIGARIKAAIDQKTDTMLLGVLGSCPEMAVTVNDNEIGERRNSKPRRAPYYET